MSDNQAFSDTNNAAFNAPSQQSNTQAPQAGASGGNGDALDKGVDFLERKAGHEQVGVHTELPLNL